MTLFVPSACGYQLLPAAGRRRPGSICGGPSSDGPDGQPRRPASLGDGPGTRADSPLSSRSGGRDAETRNAPAEQRLDLLGEHSRGQLETEES